MARPVLCGVRPWIVAGVAVATISSLTACRQESRPASQPTTANAVALRATTVPVDGMICQVCAGTVKNALKKVNGVEGADISLEKRTAVIRYDEHRVTLEQLTRAIKDAGFKPGTPEPVQSR